MEIESEARYYISKGRVKFPKEVRQLIYHKADGRCALCGRKILYDDMSLDHITPLSMDGADSVENLQSTCISCNMFKGSVLPEDFFERITEIFMYQTEKKMGNTLKWKLVNRLLRRM